MKFCCYGTRRLEAQDGTIILPFMKCDANDKCKGSVFVKEGRFCGPEGDRVDSYELDGLSSLSPTVLSQTFLALYDEFVEENE